MDRAASASAYSDAAPSEGSAVSASPSSAFYAARHDPAGQPQPQWDGGRPRTPRPLPPIGAILGAFFALLMLAVVLASSWHFLVSGPMSVPPSSLVSSLVKGSSLSYSSRTTVSTTLSEPSVMGVLVSSPREGIRLILTNHLRSLAVMGVGLVLLAALTTAVALLAKKLSEPPLQSVENNTTSAGSAGHGHLSFSDLAEDFFHMSPAALGALIGGIGVLVLMLIVLPPVFLTRCGGRPKDPRQQGLFMDSNQMLYKLDDLFDSIKGIVDELIENRGGPGEVRDELEVEPSTAAKGNLVVTTVYHFMSQPLPQFYVKPKDDLRVAGYFTSILFNRNSFGSVVTSLSLRFVLFAITKEGRILNASEVAPQDSKFVIVDLDNFADHRRPELIRAAFDSLTTCQDLIIAKLDSKPPPPLPVDDDNIT